MDGFFPGSFVGGFADPGVPEGVGVAEESCDEFLCRVD